MVHTKMPHNGLNLFVRDAVKLNAPNTVNGIVVTLTATDNNSNSAIDQAIVTVLDTTAPIMITNTITVALVNTNTYTLSQAEIDQFRS